MRISLAMAMALPLSAMLVAMTVTVSVAMPFPFTMDGLKIYRLRKLLESKLTASSCFLEHGLNLILGEPMVCDAMVRGKFRIHLMRGEVDNEKDTTRLQAANQPLGSQIAIVKVMPA